jgi:pimeloyl-ACP methyl ester carboxylesterase
VNETPFFFRRGQAQLFGLVHAPLGSASPLAFVLSHSIAEEKLWSHRVMVSMARALASRGHAVLRFDYMGAGDSSGETPDTSLESHLADLAAACVELRRRQPQVERVGIVGLRFGASIGALFAESTEGAALLGDAPLVLWDPVLDGESYFQELLRSNLSTQLAVYGKVQETREVLQERIRAGGTVNVDGYEIGKALFDSCARTDFIGSAARRHGGPVLAVQITASDKNKTRDDLESFARSYPRGEFTRSIEQAFWREIKPFYGSAVNLQQQTLAWLEKSNV